MAPLVSQFQKNKQKNYYKQKFLEKCPKNGRFSADFGSKWADFSDFWKAKCRFLGKKIWQHCSLVSQFQKNKQKNYYEQKSLIREDREEETSETKDLGSSERNKRILVTWNWVKDLALCL